MLCAVIEPFYLQHPFPVFSRGSTWPTRQWGNSMLCYHELFSGGWA